MDHAVDNVLPAHDNGFWLLGAATHVHNDIQSSFQSLQKIEGGGILLVGSFDCYFLTYRLTGFVIVIAFFAHSRGDLKFTFQYIQ